MESNSKKKSNYHHGDLQDSLIKNATVLIEQQGVEALSMRKLGQLAGVSRTALYHHFANKTDLLSAVAEQGFINWQRQTATALLEAANDPKQIVDLYLNSYFDFALRNPAIYELMFGKTIWLEQASSDSLHQTAHASFQYHLELIAVWQAKKIVNADIAPLRLAQVTWGALHGICRFFMDGIYMDKRHLPELTASLSQLLRNKNVA